MLTARIRHQIGFIFFSRLLLLSLFHGVNSQADPGYTIYKESAYAAQRTCVQLCFYNYSPVQADKLPGYLGCPWNGAVYPSACVCRTDLASSASSYISSCANSRCSNNAPDVTSAVSLLGSYCTRNIVAEATQANPSSVAIATSTAYVNGPPTTSFTTMSGGGAGNGGGTGPITVYTGSPTGQAAADNAAQGPVLSTGLTVGVVMLAILVIIAGAAIIFLLVRRRKETVVTVTNIQQNNNAPHRTTSTTERPPPYTTV